MDEGVNMEKTSQIYVAGHRGLVGSAIVRALTKEGHRNILTRTREELDLTSQAQVEKFFGENKIDYVFLAAARVGGILANDTYPVEFLYENLMIQSNVLHAAHKQGVKKLEFLGSSCVYPRMAPQPITEDSLLTGPLEKTNEAYAVAKIAGIKLAEYYTRQYQFQTISLMPTNLYGPYDNFDLKSSHVLPALIRKFHEAKIRDERTVEIWGTGAPRREFLFIEDMGGAAVYLMKNYNDPTLINVGVGEDITIKELAEVIKEVVGYEGELVFDETKPDGTPRKLLDVTKLKKAGWEAKTPLREGIRKTYDWFTEHYEGIVGKENLTAEM